MKYQDKQKRFMLFKIAMASFILLLVILVSFLLADTIEQRQQNEILSKKIEAITENHQLDILKLNEDIGLADSQLTTQQLLNEQYKRSLTEKDQEFEKMRKKYSLEIKSRDNTIAHLKGTSTGGTTTVEGDCKQIGLETPVLAYTWEDSLQRFKLNDPDIFRKDNEVFTYEQKIKVSGEIFSDKSGNIKARRVQLQEVWGKDNKTVASSNVKLVASDFTYVNEKQENTKNFVDIFTFRPLATFDIALMPGIGFEVVNLGRLVDYTNLGVYTKLSADLKDPLKGSLQNSRIGIGINYHFIPPVIKTNFAIGAAINLPFNKLDSPVLTVDAILYLTEDLNPFVENK
jgi:hypothetical protein